MRRLLIVVCAIVLVDTAFFAAITPLLPRYTAEFGLTKAAAGVLAAAYPAGTLLAALPSGWLAGRLGVRFVLVGSLALIAAASLAFAFAPSVGVLDAARFAQGLGGAGMWAAGLAWLVAAAPAEQRGQTLGTALGFAVAGALLGPVLGGAATVIGPELVFSAVAVVCGLLAVAVSTAGPPPAPEHISFARLAGALRAPALLAGLWLMALPAAGSGVINVLAPLRLDALGVAGAVIGATWLVAAAAEALLSPAIGRYSDRRGRMAPLRMSLVAGAVAALILAVPSGAVAVVAIVVLASLAFGSFFAPAMAFVSDASESLGLAQTLAISLLNVAWAGGQMLGGGAGSSLAQATSDSVPYAVLALLCAGTFAALGRTARAVIPASRPAGARPPSG